MWWTASSHAFHKTYRTEENTSFWCPQFTFVWQLSQLGYICPKKAIEERSLNLNNLNYFTVFASIGYLDCIWEIWGHGHSLQLHCEINSLRINKVNSQHLNAKCPQLFCHQVIQYWNALQLFLVMHWEESVCNSAWAPFRLLCKIIPFLIAVNTPEMCSSVFWYSRPNQFSWYFPWHFIIAKGCYCLYSAEIRGRGLGIFDKWSVGAFCSENLYIGFDNPVLWSIHLIWEW